MNLIVGDAAVVISLLTPAGVEVTAANGSSLGFTLATYTVDDKAVSDIPALAALPGPHTLIQFPAGQPPGIYRIKADTSKAAGDTAMFVMYLSNPSGVSVGATTDATTYRTAEFVILSALVFDGNKPVQNAKVAATAVATVPFGAAIGNYRVVSQQTQDNGDTVYNYSAEITNRGAAAAGVEAFASPTAPNVNLHDSYLAFGNVAAGASVGSVNTFSIVLPAGGTFDPAMLRWKITSQTAPLPVALMDSGLYDAAPGDGVYTGVFTPPVPGSYHVFLTVTGTSASGLPFTRTANAGFDVDEPMAQIVGFSDSLLPSADGAAFDHLEVLANVSIQKAGPYRLTLDLVGSNGRTVEDTASGTLAVGGQQLTLRYSAVRLMALGVDGPFKETNARLIYEGTDPGGLALADLKENVGQTGAYSLTTLREGQFYLTGQNDVRSVDSNGVPGFEALDISVGIAPQTSGTCQGTAVLYAGNTRLDSAAFFRSAIGLNAVTFRFNGYHIRRAGLNGPYTLTGVEIACPRGKISSNNLVQTPAYDVTQFEAGQWNFSLTAPGSVVKRATFPTPFNVKIAYQGGFNDSIGFTVTGLPEGSTAQVYFPTVMNASLNLISISITTTSTPSGRYPLTVTGASGALRHSVTVTYVVP